MEGGGEVVAEFADVAGVKTPVLARNNGGGDLSTGEYGCGGVLDFGSPGGVTGEWDYGVCGIQADADKVNLRRFRHPFTLNEWNGSNTEWPVGAPK